MNKHFEQFEDLKIGMLVRTCQSKHIDHKILAIKEENPFHIVIGKVDDDYAEKKWWFEEMHHLNLYQIFIDGEWVQYTH